VTTTGIFFTLKNTTHWVCPMMGCERLRRAGGSRARPGRARILDGGEFVSIVRVGLSETKNFAEGYDAIFGKKDAEKAKKSEAGATGGKANKKKAGKKKK
jgi:hypothetical protein